MTYEREAHAVEVHGYGADGHAGHHPGFLHPLAVLDQS